LRLDGDRLELSTEAGDGTSAPTLRSDSGGLGTLAQRLMERLGWRCEQASAGRIVLLLPATATDDTLAAG
jgi:hypothetical protein